jgi:hypothetical protein
VTATEIRAKALDLVNTLKEKGSKEEALSLTPALATLEVAAQLAELNERLANLTVWGANGLALRVEKTL